MTPNLGTDMTQPRLTTLDFLRHGEPVGGKRYRGQIDDPLSDKGWAQMRAATAGNRPWQGLVSSPLTRCRAFADALGQDMALPVTVVPGFAEVGFGVWEGRSASEINAADADTVFDFKRDPLGRRPEGAEALADFHARVVTAYEATLAAHAGRHVLVVAHAGVMRMVASHVLGLDPARSYRLNVGSAALMRVRVEQRGAKRLDTLMWLGRGEGGE